MSKAVTTTSGGARLCGISRPRMGVQTKRQGRWVPGQCCSQPVQGRLCPNQWCMASLREQ
eukprot:1914327-Rhodomonas_salina.1